MDDISMDKISELLSSPDLLSNIQSVLGKLDKNDHEKPDIVVSEEEQKSSESASVIESLGGEKLLSSISSFLSQNKTERIALLTALRPFLSSEKQQTLDAILKILKAANIFLAANMLT